MKKQINNIELYYNFNNKPTYYRVKRNKAVEYIEPSFVFELLYFNEIELLQDELKSCYIEKEKKVYRHTNLSIEKLEDRLYRSLVNKDKYHTLELANELILRDAKKFFDIMYDLSFLAEDENKLIKTYLYELMFNNTEYNVNVLKNLIKYFTSSCNKYMLLDDESQKNYFYSNISPLYIYVYNIKSKEYNRDKLNFSSEKNMSKVKETIYRLLLKGI